jgi:hypothetical protein
MYPSYSFSSDRQPSRADRPSPSDAYRRAYRTPDAQPAPADTSSERAVPQADGEP